MMETKWVENSEGSAPEAGRYEVSVHCFNYGDRAEAVEAAKRITELLPDAIVLVDKRHFVAGTVRAVEEPAA